ncbi:DUF559 domain-containing protein [Desulfobacterales bacterium HSG2]|nr:DUF559 domain-containing protein [Desulfobacterales bacterium HSG2]
MQNIATKGIPKTLRPFADKGLNIATKTVAVVAENSHHKGRKITVYDSCLIESLIQAYAFALAGDKLRKAQHHIGKRCVFLMGSLVRTALDTAIREACGLSSDIQETARKNYTNIVELVREFGFTCSVGNDIATKKDITRFLGIPESTLNSFLRKHKNEISPVRLGLAAIRSAGSKASRMNGYHPDDVARIVMGMDSVVGMELKKRVFGQVCPFVRPDTREEIRWRKVLSEIFDGFDLRCNHPVGKYRVDFFVAKLMLVLECNGYCHRYYDPVQEAEREKFISRRYGIVRFDHNVSLETLFNGILQAKSGTVVRLYDFRHLGKAIPSDVKKAA